MESAKGEELLKTMREHLNHIALPSADTAMFLPWIATPSKALPDGNGCDLAGSGPQLYKGKSGFSWRT